MKETDIRPDSLHQGQIKAFQHDIKRLLEHDDEFKYVLCPACNELDRTYFIGKDGFEYNICKKCDTIYINPRPTPQLLEDYYKHSEHYKYWAKYIFPQTEKVRREQIFKPRAKKVAELIDRYFTPSRWRKEYDLIEIGAGYGTFCEEISKCVKLNHLIAIEPSVLAKTCHKKGIKTYQMTAEKFAKDMIGKADIAVAFELIEHLFNPKEFIKNCRLILSEGGLLILTCPNAKGFDMSVLGEKSESFNPEHLNYFNPKSLSLLVENSGFEVLEISTPGKLDVELVKKQAKKDDLSPFMWGLVNLGDKFQTFLQENCLSSHLWMVARKK